MVEVPKIEDRIGDTDAGYIDSLNLSLKELASIPMIVEKHQSLGERIFEGQLVINYFNSLPGEMLDSQDVDGQIKNLLESKRVRTMATEFGKRLLRVRAIVQRFKNIEEIDLERYRIDEKDIELLAIVDGFNTWIESKLDSGGAQDVIAQQVGVIKEAESAFDEMSTANMRLVVSIAKKYTTRGVELSDLIGYGYIGLIKAVCHYDYRKEFQFSTYATWWIRQSITRAIADYGSLIRLPVHIHEHVLRLQRESRNSVNFSDLANDEEVRNNKNLRDALNTKHVASFNKVVSTSISERTELGDLIPGDFDVEELAQRTALRIAIENVLDAIPWKLRRVLILRHGLEDGIPRTLEETGQELNLTRERIRQIEKQALRLLKHPSRSITLKDFL